MITILSSVSNGKLPTTHSNEIRTALLSLEGKKIEITIKKARSKRSDPQNRYYWGCVVPIVCEALKELGHRLNKEECHEYLKMKFNYKTLVNENTGVLVGDIPQSTTTLSKMEFVDYIDKIVQWSAEILDIIIPEPNEQVTINYN